MIARTTRFRSRLDAARGGDGDALQWIWRTYAGPIRGYLQARGTPEVDEVVNDVFLAAFDALGRFSGEEPMFRAWIYALARNKRIDALRRHARRAHEVAVHAYAAAGDVEAEAMALLEDADLRAVLLDLTPEQRDVIVLRFVADLSIEQVAVALERNPAAVKALQHRAIGQLRKKIRADPHPDASVPTM